MTLTEAADAAARTVLENLWMGAPAQRVDSPPGAGKTGLVERVAALLLGVMHARCAIATTTNEQCFDLARRLADAFRTLEFTLFVSDKLELPGDLSARPNLRIATKVDELPEGPCVVLANAAKWSWIQGDVRPFDLLVVDEAFQLPDYRFALIAGIATKILLVGDPGQIAPVISCSVERWRADPTGPQVPCPDALVARHPWVPRVRLPVSRRLVADTVSVVQPAFYPDLPFAALDGDGARGLVLQGRGSAALDAVARGVSLVLAELPEAVTAPVDGPLADAVVWMVGELFARRAVVRDRGTERVVRAEDVGVVCAHVAQVNAVRARLPEAMAGVLVETAERFQGLERALMFVHHPLSGRASLSEFQLDAGRLCVMTTRHRVGCVIVARAGTEERLMRHAPSGERVLGRARDDAYEGWRANREVFAALRARGRCVAG